MTKNRGNGESAMILSQHNALLLLLILILPFVLAGHQAVVRPKDDRLPKVEYIGNPVSNMFKKDPVMSLLGISFLEIKQVLGEPDEQGYSGWLGPHRYILYRYEEGFIQFCSPELMENEVAVSIILGPGQEVFGAKVGMRFPEITGILGAPDFGPEIGMDNLYYMDYFGGEINDQISDVSISFVAASMNSPTDHVFLKWEAFEHEKTEIF